MQDLVTIYSGEHCAYWGENGGGYTSAQYAGVHTREDAIRRTSHCGPEKRIEFHPVSEGHGRARPCGVQRLPTISPSSDADWLGYYERKYNETDKQLKDLAWAMAHMIRLGMEGKHQDIYMLGQRVARRLQYPRDKDSIIAELANWPEFAGSVLREEK